VDQIFVRALLVGGVLQADLEDFGIVQQLLMEAQDLLILAIHRWRHNCSSEMEGTGANGGRRVKGVNLESRETPI
jgi:hypothetical protein